VSDSWDRLRGIVDRLRDPVDGCPWDLEQDLESLLPYTIEEVYELVDAVEGGDMDGLRDELGDLAFHVLFYARIAAEQGAFTADEVLTSAADKLVRRHPHVFDGHHYADAGARERAWAEIKSAERAASGRDIGAAASALAGIARALPALVRADKVLHRAALAGFAWSDRRQALSKIDEELAEVREAIDAGDDHRAVEDEIGDLLLAIVGLARRCGVDAETALRRATDRFTARFGRLEALAASDGRAIDGMTDEALLALWRRAKGAGATEPS